VVHVGNNGGAIQKQAIWGCVSEMQQVELTDGVECEG
jgi:hypothetical protein